MNINIEDKLVDGESKVESLTSYEIKKMAKTVKSKRFQNDKFGIDPKVEEESVKDNKSDKINKSKR